MQSLCYLRLSIIACCLNIFIIIDADHCDVKTDDHLLAPKEDLNISLEEPDNCTLSYLAVLHPLENPVEIDGCKIRGFHLNDGTVGPSCIPEIGNLEKNKLFSINIQSHGDESGLLLEVFLKCSTFEDFKNAALYYKSKVNPQLFSYTFSSAILNRKDTHAFPVPSLLQTQPDLLFNSHIIQQATQKIKRNEDKALGKYKKNKKKYIEINDIHEKSKYNRNQQTFHENKNNENFKPKLGKVDLSNSANLIHNGILTDYTLPNSQKSPIVPHEENSQNSKVYPQELKFYVLKPNPVKRNEEILFIPNKVIKPEAAVPKKVKPQDKQVFSSPPEDSASISDLQDVASANFFPKEPKTEKLPVIPLPVEKEFLELEADLTGNSKDAEHKVSYFREDIALNSHHSHWHLSYPMMWDNRKGYGIKDRKGELFYYMHNQMIRRYDGARIAAGLKYVEPLDIKKSGTVIEEGYYPHLTSSSTGNSFSGRTKNLKLQDVQRSDVNNIYVDDLLMFVNNVKKGINDGYLEDIDGNKVTLSEDKGIDLLGSTVESNAMSVNRDKYGNIHNFGHLLLSFIHDSQGEFNAPAGVMITPETALRDPIFWRWHKFVDNLLTMHKVKLPPYKNNYLQFSGVEITDAVIKTVNNDDQSYQPNTCYTYIRIRSVDLSGGLDFSSTKNAVSVKLKHLDHLPFTYAIKIHSTSSNDIEGQVRIFISPKYTLQKKLATDEQLREHAIEMDRFKVMLNHGENIITRKSGESAVTMLPGKQWSEASNFNLEFKQSEGGGACGCGWPDHLLLPKGNSTGIKYVLFVMVSNWKQEKNGKAIVERMCDDSLTMCGLLNEPFPDKRAMGFPLDRPFHGKKNWFKRPNMIKRDITIYHLKSYTPKD